MVVKVCGMREAENIRAIEKTGADLMGFICWPKSKRFVDTTPQYLPQCERVGVFVDASLKEIQHYVEMLGLNRIQLHGHETPEFCEDVKAATNLPVMKAISIASDEDIQLTKAYDGVVDAFVFDTKCSGMGGSGRQFDWQLLEGYHDATPFLLSGGIGPDDAERLKRWNHPQCIGYDINSRFETSPAIKDYKVVNQFITKIKEHTI